jgi:SNF2 family DNA or RNA helicase
LHNNEWFKADSSPSGGELLDLHNMPGPYWNSRQWMIPVDLGWRFGCADTTDTEMYFALLDQVNPKLFPWQKEAVVRTVLRKNFLAVFEMGLGKTVYACEVMHLTKAATAVIVCPSAVKYVWESHLDIWYPGHPEVQVIEKGKDSWNAPIIVVSYELAVKHWQDGWCKEGEVKHPADVIVWDEAHYLKEEDTTRSKMGRDVCLAHKHQYKIMLTGTPITNEPKDLWHVNRCLRGLTFGGKYDFTHRYCLIDVNDYGHPVVHGLDDDYAEELQKRVSTYSLRATKDDPAVAKHLPPLTMQRVDVKKQKGTDWRTMLDKWSGERRMHDADLEAYLQKTSSAKVQPAIDLALEALDGGHSHIAIFTYFHDTAHTITEHLRGVGEDVVEVTGNIPPKARKKLLDSARAKKRCILVATMRSVGEGIDLTFCTGSILAELSYVPAHIIQLIGRVHRLSSGKHAHVWILTVKGTLDEVIVERLLEKQKNINAIFAAGTTEKALVSALTPAPVDHQSIVDELMVAISKRKEDPYV